MTLRSTKGVRSASRGDDGDEKGGGVRNTTQLPERSVGSARVVKRKRVYSLHVLKYSFFMYFHPGRSRSELEISMAGGANVIKISGSLDYWFAFVFMEFVRESAAGWGFIRGTEECRRRLEQLPGI